MLRNMDSVGAGRRRIMQGNRSRDTKPELRVRRILHSRGLRYRVNYRPEKALRRTADIVFTRQRVAIFIDGCFWHRCPEHGRTPATNSDYWKSKLDRNQERDEETRARLCEDGWKVLRFWEHQPADEVAERIAKIIEAERNRGPES